MIANEDTSSINVALLWLLFAGTHMGLATERPLDGLAEFTGAFEHMIEGFAERADQVARLLRSPSTAFVLVTTPEPHTVATTIGFHRELAAERYPVAGVIANRVLAFPELAEDARGQGLPENLRHRLLANYDDMRKLSRGDVPLAVKSLSVTVPRSQGC